MTRPLRSVAFRLCCLTAPLLFAGILTQNSEAQTVKTLAGHTGNVWSVAYSPDGRTLASGSWDSSIRIWNAQTGELLRILTGHHGPVKSVAYSPDGHTLASVGDDHSIRIWNAQPASFSESLQDIIA